MFINSSVSDEVTAFQPYYLVLGAFYEYIFAAVHYISQQLQVKNVSLLVEYVETASGVLSLHLL